MVREHQASELTPFDQAMTHLPEHRRHLDKILFRLSRVADLPERPAILDIGAAQGLLLIAAAHRGLTAVGIEPHDQARAGAIELAGRMGLTIDIRPGAAEKMDLPDNSFDIVNATSVLEHVHDPAAVMAEVCRVLKPGGVFWFCTASSVCPRQREIAVFPCFSWYPDALKRRLMVWAARRRPAWVGHTQTPAVHWFTPGKARRMLLAAGFSRVYDRWDLRRPEEGGRLHRMGLRIIQRWRPARWAADVAVEACSYAAVK
ncbi:MAG: class I SAM-dependent methyltransferase [Phycisphaerae bacterium]|jgi:SAM-dependent methyltransferase